MAQSPDIHDEGTHHESPQRAEPLARMMSGSAGTPALTLLAVVVAAILAVVLYGLNGPEAPMPTAPPGKAPAAAGNASPPLPTGPRTTPHAPG